MSRQLTRLERKLNSDIAMILQILRSQVTAQPSIPLDSQVTPPDGNMPPPPDYSQLEQEEAYPYGDMLKKKEYSSAAIQRQNKVVSIFLFRYIDIPN